MTTLWDGTRRAIEMIWNRAYRLTDGLRHRACYSSVVLWQRTLRSTTLVSEVIHYLSGMLWNGTHDWTAEVLRNGA